MHLRKYYFKGKIMKLLTIEEVKAMTIQMLLEAYSSAAETIGYHSLSGNPLGPNDPAVLNQSLLWREIIFNRCGGLDSIDEKNEIQVSVVKKLTEDFKPINSFELTFHPWKITQVIINLLKNKKVTLTEKQIVQIEEFIFQYCSCNTTIDRALVLEIATYINGCN